MKKPPPTPEAKLLRVLRIARMNGLSVVIFASLGVLISIGDWFGMIVGAVIAYGGWLELSGRKQLLENNVKGVRLLVRSQLVVLAAIEIYCAVKLGFDHNHGVSPEMRETMQGMDIEMAAFEPMLRLAFYGTYSAVALLTFIYQGGMARYYSRSADLVQQAVAARLRPAAAPGQVADPEDELT